MDGSEIRALARLLDRMDYYKLLRVDHGAPLPVIRAAYQRMRRTFHPDAFSQDENDVKQAVDRISKRLNEAYLTLRDGGKRTAYDQGLSSGDLRYDPKRGEEQQKQAEEARGKTPNGRRCFAQAENHLRNGETQQAVMALQMALTFEPQNEHFKAQLATLKPAKKKR